MAPGARGRGAGPRLAGLVLAAISGLACGSTRLATPVPVAESASAAMLEAWETSRVEGFGDDQNAVERALARAEEAARLEPGWAAPVRFVDDWRHRRDLTLPGRYGEHLAEARRGSAVGAYLAGRLGGDAADRRLDQARRLDPLLGWAWHGSAWRSFARGRVGPAIAGGQRALRLAKGPSELAHFSWALGRYLRSEERDAAARGVLGAALDPARGGALRPSERAMIGCELALAELESVDDAARRRGAERGLAVLGSPFLTVQERVQLAVALAGQADELVPAEVLELALHDAGATALLEPSPPRGRRAVLAAAFGRTEGDPAGGALAAFRAWAAGLPPWLLDAAGAPRAPRLARIGRALERRAAGEASLAELAEALLDAGWFTEAAAALDGARTGPEAEALRGLRRRALEGRALLARVAALARRIDAGRAFLRAGAVGADGVTSAEGGRVDSLGELAEEVARILGDEAAADASPRIRYGPIGAVLHPGPRLSAEDDGRGLGPEGAEVGGVTGLFRRMGRFALLGQGVGQGGPDATVLRLVDTEVRTGEHLGRPYGGTVFWCEGADVPGRFGRLGAAISGAALHEGYYVDLAMVAVEKDAWDGLRARFQGRPSAIRRALDARPAAVPAVQRTETSPPLGAADRMRLAVMGERAAALGGGGGALAEVSLGDLAHVVAVHEEGHLCDRRQWFPLDLGRVLALLGFAGAHGFDGAAIARALEARAQLVALCVADDVRLAWVDVLDAAEGEAGGVTPHARAYRALLEDLMERLEREWRDGGWRDAGLDPGGRWVDQLHRVDPERLRALAVREARARGLAR